MANSVAGQSARLSAQFAHGLADLETSLAGAPFHLRAVDLGRLGEQARGWVSANTASLVGSALGGAGVAAELLTGLALAVFCSVFFLASGERIWAWVTVQLGARRRRWDTAARAGWTTFAGYTRGVVVIAATNAVLVGVALLLLRVPLALPLALLVFFAAFVPLVGAPIALGRRHAGGAGRTRSARRDPGGRAHRGHRTGRGAHPAPAGHGPRRQPAPAGGRAVGGVRDRPRRA